MFNKRENEHDPADRGRNAGSSSTPGGPDRPTGAGSSGATAIIGPSISINGELKGQEDLIVEGTIQGTVELKQNTLTIGSQGTIKAQVYAHTILVDGTVDGDLYASERISIRKTARIEGNILAPRISLEDGAKFRGSIDMDSESEAFRKVFQPRTGASPAPKATGAADKSASDSGERTAPDSPLKGEAGKNATGKPTQSAV